MGSSVCSGRNLLLNVLRRLLLFVVRQKENERLRLARRLFDSPMLATWVSFGVKALLPISVLPFVLAAYDPAAVTVWLLFATIGGLASIMDFGLQQTTARFVAYRASEPALLVQSAADVTDAQSWLGIAQVMSAARIMYSRLGIASAVTIAVAGSFVVEGPIASAGGGVWLWAAWLTVPMGLLSLLSFNHWAALLLGTNKIPTLRIVEIVSGLGSFLLSIVIIRIDLPFPILLVVAPLSQLATAAGFRLACARVYPRRVIAAASGRSQRGDSLPLGEIWRPTWRSGLGMLASLGLFHLATIAYGVWLPAAEAASFLLACRVVLAISVISQAPFYTRLPRYAAQWAAGERSRILTDAKERMRLAYLVFVIGAGAVAHFGQPIMDWIGSATPFVSPTLWAVLSVAIFVERWGAMHLQLYSVGNHIVWHIANGATGAVVVLLTVSTVRILGVLSFPVALLVGNLALYVPFCATRSYRQFHVTRPLRFELGTVAPFASALLLVLGASVAADYRGFLH